MTIVSKWKKKYIIIVILIHYNRNIIKNLLLKQIYQYKLIKKLFIYELKLQNGKRLCVLILKLLNTVLPAFHIVENIPNLINLFIIKKVFFY